MRPKVLLVTTVKWPSAARLAGAFANLGAEVSAIFPRGHVLGASRYLTHSYRYRVFAGPKSVATAIARAAPDHVIPCDDRALRLVLSQTPFTTLLKKSLGPLDAFDSLIPRAASMAAAMQEGIITPLTLGVEGLADLPSALAAVGLPCVMKSDESWGGAGVRVVRTLADATKAFAALHNPPARWRSLARAILRKDTHFLLDARYPRAAAVSVQSFVQGTPATSVFAARDGNVLGAMHMDVMSCQGTTGPASLMRRLLCPAMDEAAKKIAARFQLNGLHGLDFMRDADGVPHLIEINPRATQICHLPLEADLPACLLGVTERPSLTAARQIALFPQLLGAENLPDGVFQDIPWDDPGVLSVAAGDAMPDASVTTFIEQLGRPGKAPPIFRRHA